MSAREPGDDSAQSSSSAGGTGALSHFGVCCFWTLGPVSHLSAALVHSAGPRPGHVTSPPALNLPWLSGPQTPSLPPEVWPEQLRWPLCARASGRLRLPLPRARLPASWSSVVSRASGPAWTVGRLSATPVGHRQVTLSLPGPGHRVVWGGRRPQGLMSLKILAGMDSAAVKAGSKWPPPRPPALMMECLLAAAQERVSSRSAVRAHSPLWFLSASMDPSSHGWACVLSVGLRSGWGLMGFVQ